MYANRLVGLVIVTVILNLLILKHPRLSFFLSVRLPFCLSVSFTLEPRLFANN